MTPTHRRFQAVREQVEISVKYEGIRRQLSQVEEFESWSSTPCLRTRTMHPSRAAPGGQRKLNAVRPLNLGQASRISGVSRRTWARWMIYLEKRGSKMNVIELTHTIQGDMPVYPGTEQPVLTTACTIRDAGYRETILHMYSHTRHPWMLRPT